MLSQEWPTGILQFWSASAVASSENPTAHREERQIIDSLIDDMGAQSFPASDPPAWDTVSSRLEEIREHPTAPPHSTIRA